MPGSFTQDSLYTLNEALTTPVGQFYEGLSPAYSLIWKVIVSVGAAIRLSPFLQMSVMCVLQTLLIIGALIQLLHANSTINWWATTGVAAAVSSWPAVFVYFGEVWRDVLMAALLLVAVCLLDSVRRTGSRRVLLGAIAVLFLADLMRQNAIAAELPLFVWCALLSRGVQRTERRRAFTIGVAAVLVASASAFGVVANRLLASTNFGRATAPTIYYDLMGVSVRANALLVPRAGTVPEYSLENARSRYQDQYADLAGVTLPVSAAEMKALAASWRDAVLTRPGDYLRHRWFVTRRLLGISGVPHLAYFYGIPESYYPRYVSDERYYVPFPNPPPRTWVARYLALFRPWLFRPWIYGVLTLGVLFFYRHRAEAPFWLCASGGLYEASFFLAAPATDFRYSWWSVLAVMTALALIGVRARGKIRREGPLP